MPLDARSTAVSVAVICFFGLSFIGWISDLAPFTCCKRAVVGSLVAYITAKLIIKAVNKILTDAMIMNRLKQQKDESSGN